MTTEKRGYANDDVSVLERCSTWGDPKTALSATRDSFKPAFLNKDVGKEGEFQSKILLGETHAEVSSARFHPQNPKSKI
jgi:hypothetical protein